MSFSALDSALTGPLFATDAMRQVFSHRSRLAAMLRAEAALARAQAKLALVPDGLAPAIEAISADDLDLEQIGRETQLSMVPTIPFVKAVQARLPPELEPAFHKGSTTQDILDTALVLQMREAFELLATDLVGTIQGLATLAERHRRTPCVGRTYGQHAAPVSFGFKVAVWCAGLAEVAEGLPRLRERALSVSCGGPVGTLAAFGEAAPAVADGFAAELGLGCAPISWHVRRGRIVQTGAWLGQLLGALGKMATDISDLVSTDVAEAAEPYQLGRGGSSAMPHKRNPVSTTVILAAASASKGFVVTLLDGMVAAHERPSGAWHAEWHALPQLFGLASGALREGRTLAEGLEVFPERMSANLDRTNGLLFADAAASRLAPRIGREAAHARVQAASEEVRRTGRPLRGVLKEAPGLEAGDRSEVEAAFKLTTSLDAAAAWTDRALAEATLICEGLAR